MQVLAIPGEQKIHAMGGSQREMDCIRRDGGRNDLLFEKPGYQCIRFGSGAEARQTVQYREPFGGKSSVAIGGFLQDGFRNEQVILAPVTFPPCLRGFLVSREPQVAAGARHEITRNGGFDVEARLQS